MGGETKASFCLMFLKLLVDVESLFSSSFSFYLLSSFFFFFKQEISGSNIFFYKQDSDHYLDQLQTCFDKVGEGGTVSY